MTTTKRREVGRSSSAAVAGAVGSAVGAASLMAASAAAGLTWGQAPVAAFLGAMLGGVHGWAFGMIRRTAGFAALRERAVARHEKNVRESVEALREVSARPSRAGPLPRS